MRKKVKLAFIMNDSARKISYRKRKRGLLKKIEELATLCGIEACAIVSSPFDPTPELWPSPNEVERVVNKFRAYPEFEQSKNMLNQESFLKQMFVKVQDQLAKVRMNNKEIEMLLLMFQYLIEGNVADNLTMSDSNHLSMMINEKLGEVNKRMNELNIKDSTTQIQAHVVDNGATGQGNNALVDQDQGIGRNMDAIQNASWISELMNLEEDELPSFGGEKSY